jgi:hypothetical protein
MTYTFPYYLEILELHLKDMQLNLFEFLNRL